MLHIGGLRVRRAVSGPKKFSIWFNLERYFPLIVFSFGIEIALTYSFQFSSDLSLGRAVAPECGRALPGLYAERTDYRLSIIVINLQKGAV